MKHTKVAGIKLGIIAGGQLAKMLIQEASKWDIITHVLDENKSCPAGTLASRFVKGSRHNPEDVYQFGKDLDVLSYEIESINTDALYKLKKEGVKVIPDPSILELVQDKGKQKKFYARHHFPTADFELYENKNEILESIKAKRLQFPFVQKLRTGGYDGRGVSVINDSDDLSALLEGASVIEKKVEIEKEISVIVARNEQNEIRTYEAAEMVFDGKANLVDKLIFPADIDSVKKEEARQIALRLISELDMCGLLAVELFLDKTGKLIINEIAPRTHNSGHHTIESTLTSQFEQQIRAVLNLPLGSTGKIMPAVMINMLGDEAFEGKVKYTGFEKSLALEEVNIHLYGKQKTRPFRKMGHITITAKSGNIEEALTKAEKVKKLIKIKA